MRLELRDLTVRYAGRPVLNGVTVAAEPGHLTALVGPNGSGKSTLMRAVAGLVPAEGTIQIGGRVVDLAWRRTHRTAVGYLPQDSASRVALTVAEVVLLGRLSSLGLQVRAEDLASVHDVLQELGLIDLAGHDLADLSGGQRQLVYLAQALVGGPGVLLLDEPTSALDLRHQMEVLELVQAETRRRHITTVVAIHDLNAAARFFDAVAVLDGGRLWTRGAPGDILTESMLAAVYGVEASVTSGRDGRPAIIPVRATTKRYQADTR